jgi:hypothetical protein
MFFRNFGSLSTVYPTAVRTSNPTKFYRLQIVKLNYNKKIWEELIAYFPLYDTGHIENDASNNSSIVACVRYRGNVCTEPLPSNDRGIH